MRRTSRALLAGAVVAAALLPVRVSASMPWPAPAPGQDPYAYQQYLRSATPPSDFSANDWKLNSAVDPAVPPTAQELGGVMGPSVDQAWKVTTGRPDVRIAVLDSGIEWNNHDAMVDLRNKVFLNWAELPPPVFSDVTGTHLACTGVALPARQANTPFPHCYDVNHDGVFNLQDYATDPRVLAPTHTLFVSGLLTPEDLIEVFSCYDAAANTLGHFVNVTATGPRHCSNGAENLDNDHDGFSHDIAGWNFMERTNDPFDEPNYGHGTGEARDSTAEANNGSDLGTCPNCMVLPLKVGDSFIADVNDFAQATLFAVDQGVAVVQEALGTLNHSSLGQAAVDYAYRHGVVVVASAADEEAAHNNWPSSYNHTLVVNSIRSAEVANSVPNPAVPQQGRSYLVLNGCTNYGGHIVVSVPSASCSSEATGKSAGMLGLLESVARNAVADGTLVPYAPGIPISANEAKQIVAGNADDINLEDATGAANPNACVPHAAYPPGPPANYSSLEGGERYHSIAGWDQYTGYGRINANCMVHAITSGRIPPEASIDGPAWFANLDTTSTASFPITGFVAARRASSYTYAVQVAYGVQPHEGDWTTVYTSPTRTSPLNGTLATLTAAQVTAAMAKYNPAAYTHAVNPNGDQTDWRTAPVSTNALATSDSQQFTLTVRLRVTDSRQLVGEDRKSLQSHHDDSVAGVGTAAAHFPMSLGTDGAGSPASADLLGNNQKEIVFGTSDGQVHAIRSDGTELPGWPVSVSPLAYHTGEPAFSDPAVHAVSSRVHSAIIASVAIGDLDRTGHLQVVAADMSGYIYAFEADGSLRHGFPVRVNPSYSAQGTPPAFNRNRDNRVQFGFLASPALADLDHTGQLSIVDGALDRHVYAWSGDGALRPGFPVLLAAPEKVQSVDATTHRITLKPNSGADIGTKIVSAPAIGDLLGDGHQEIVIGRNEEYSAAQDGGFNASADSFPLAQVLAASGTVSIGNGRLYAIFADGYCHGLASCPAAPPAAVPSNAYVPHWPVKVGIADMSLLPYVGTGVDSGASLASFTCPAAMGGDKPGLKVGISAAVGPAYVFQSDGSSCFGRGPGADGSAAQDRAFNSNAPGAGNSADGPFVPAFGEGAFADLTGHGDIVYATATAGVKKLLDVAVNDHQLGAQNQLAAWSVSTGTMHPGFPHFVNDLQFLAGPAAADITGAGTQELIGGSATADLRAITPAGVEVPGFSKNTGDWTINVPLVTTLGADGNLKLVSMTRAGTLFVWNTPAGACATTSSPKFRHDAWNSGNLGVDAERPATITDLSLTPAGSSAQTLRFTAPHGDGACGNAVKYEVRTYTCPVAGSPPTFPAPVLVADAHAAGTPEAVTLGSVPSGTAVIAVSATNAAARAGGNLGAAAYIVLGTPSPACVAAIETGIAQTTPPAAVAEFDPAMAVVGTVAIGAAVMVRRRRRSA
jgi:hypothetical protein